MLLSAFSTSAPSWIRYFTTSSRFSRQAPERGEVPSLLDKSTSAFASIKNFTTSNRPLYALIMRGVTPVSDVFTFTSPFPFSKRYAAKGNYPCWHARKKGVAPSVRPLSTSAFPSSANNFTMSKCPCPLEMYKGVTPLNPALSTSTLLRRHLTT